MTARLLLAGLCAALAACSSFEGKWRAAQDRAAASRPTRWDGRWTSEKHRTRTGQPDGGRLRCVLTTGANAGHGGGTPDLHADFRANWSVFAASYTLLLTPIPGSRTEFRGTHELPAIFGGTYRYSAQISGDRFTARYDSSYDCGTFDLTRVRP